MLAKAFRRTIIYMFPTAPIRRDYGTQSKRNT